MRCFLKLMRGIEGGEEEELCSNLLALKNPRKVIFREAVVPTLPKMNKWEKFCSESGW